MGGWVRHGALALVAGTALAAGGCASMREDAAALQDVPRSVIVVENNKWEDVNVFAVREGRKARLGMVTSMTSREFTLPSWTLVGTGELRLLIDPIGSSTTHLTAPITLVGGERVDLRVENVMAFSAFMVRSQR
jgi:hypothetical protein